MRRLRSGRRRSTLPRPGSPESRLAWESPPQRRSLISPAADAHTVDGDSGGEGP